MEIQQRQHFFLTLFFIWKSLQRLFNLRSTYLNHPGRTGGRLEAWCAKLRLTEELETATAHSCHFSYFNDVITSAKLINRVKLNCWRYDCIVQSKVNLRSAPYWLNSWVMWHVSLQWLYLLIIFYLLLPMNIAPNAWPGPFPLYIVPFTFHLYYYKSIANSYLSLYVLFCHLIF